MTTQQESQALVIQALGAASQALDALLTECPETARSLLGEAIATLRQIVVMGLPAEVKPI